MEILILLIGLAYVVCLLVITAGAVAFFWHVATLLVADFIDERDKKEK